MKERSESLTVYDCLPSNDAHTFNDHSTSGVATLGHAGARALATSGRALSVQRSDSSVVDRESGAKRS